jgi:hypothetical protein
MSGIFICTIDRAWDEREAMREKTAQALPA